MIINIGKLYCSYDLSTLIIFEDKTSIIVGEAGGKGIWSRYSIDYYGWAMQLNDFIVET